MAFVDIHTNSGNNATSISSASFTPSNDEILVVCLQCENTQSDTPAIDDSASALTYNLISALALDSEGNDYMWWAHVTGSPGSITVDCSSIDAGDVHIAVVRLSGRDTTSPDGTPDTAAPTGSNNTCDVNLTEPSTSDIVCFLGCSDGTSTPADGWQESGTFRYGDVTGGAPTTRSSMGIATTVGTGAAQDVGWDWAGVQAPMISVGGISCAFAEAAGGTTVRSYLPTLGVS